MVRALRLFHRRFHATDDDLVFDGGSSRHYDLLSRTIARGLYRRLAAEIAAAAPASGSILDVGTGPGRLLVELAERRPDLHVTGVDLSPDMVALARRNALRAGLAERVEAHEADAADLPFADAGFDMVVSSLSMHHWASVGAAVAEMARVLRPGGALWIYDMRSQPDADLITAASTAFPGQTVERVLTRSGPGPLRLLARWSVVRPSP